LKPTPRMSAAQSVVEIGRAGGDDSNPEQKNKRISDSKRFSQSARLKADVMTFMRGNPMTVFSTTVIISSLFLDDLRLAVTDISADAAFWGLFCFFLFYFSFEFFLYSWAMPGYIGNFYFYLDILATLSLIPDIGWIWIPLVGDGAADAEDQEAALRTGRVSRVGTRAGRIVRLIRIIRVIRVVKVLQCLRRNKKDPVVEMKPGWEEDLHGAEDEEEELTDPSEVGKKLTESITQQVIILVLLMLLVLPVFDFFLDDGVVDFKIAGLSVLHRFPQDANISEQAYRHQIRFYAEQAGRLISLDVCGGGGLNEYGGVYSGVQAYTPAVISEWLAPTLGRKMFLDPEKEIPRQYRAQEYIRVRAAGCYRFDGTKVTEGRLTQCLSEAYFDTVLISQSDAWSSVAKTFFRTCGFVWRCTRLHPQRRENPHRSH